MPGIGDTLRDERRRQGRTLADAAAETRVRESYLAAIEEEDFGVLGGDVYARGFIKLYGKYLGLDVDALLEEFRRSHEKPEEVTAIPGATYDDFSTPTGGPGPRALLTQPVLAAAAIVGLLVVLFLAFRGSGDDGDVELDPNAPGPEPAEAASDEDAAAPSAGPADADADADPDADPDADDAAAAPPAPPPAGDQPSGEPLTELVIDVTAIEPLRLTAQQADLPVDVQLEPGESRTLTHPSAVTFTVSDFSAAEILVNGGPLVNPEFAGTAVEVTCAVGQPGCTATPR